MTDWVSLFLDIPCRQWAEASAFWAAVTHWSPSAPRGEDDQFLTLVPPSGDAWLKLQAVDGPAGVHLDVDSSDRTGAVARASHLGATPAWRYHDVEVMRSPGGLVFCHTLTAEAQRRVVRTGESIVDQVCIDVPAPLWEAEVAFWRDMTGRELEMGLRPEFAFLGDPSGGLRILLQRLDTTDGRVRGHPDFAVADRATETDRHLELGAVVIRTKERWTVLQAPGGQVYCLTDRDPFTGSVRR